MDMKTLSGRVFFQETLGKKLENGSWSVTVEMREKIILPSGEEREESIQTECVDNDFHAAHRVALHEALSELNRLVYSAGFDSLIEGRDYDREIERIIKIERITSDDNNSDQDTPTQ